MKKENAAGLLKKGVRERTGEELDENMAELVTGGVQEEAVNEEKKSARQASLNAASQIAIEPLVKDTPGGNAAVQVISPVQSIQDNTDSIIFTISDKANAEVSLNCGWNGDSLNDYFLNENQIYQDQGAPNGGNNPAQSTGAKQNAETGVAAGTAYDMRQMLNQTAQTGTVKTGNTKTKRKTR